MRLLDDDALARSSTVANCQMNRQRTLTGSNGYSRELGLDPVDLLLGSVGARVRWLDLCCGEGRALIEAGRLVQDRGLDGNCEIMGVDLIAPTVDPSPPLDCVRFVVASLADWEPMERFDLITCIHGLHYIGDKLGLIARAASWLTDTGQFAANLDLSNIKLADGRPANRIISKELRKSGFLYDSRRRLLRCVGRTPVQLPFRYLGADDQAGPNYTKQPAVDSYYELLEDGLVRQAISPGKGEE